MSELTRDPRASDRVNDGPVDAAREAFWVAADVTLAVTAVTAALPPAWHAVTVAFVFLGATWLLVWRHDDDEVQRAGLALGGLVIPGRVHVPAFGRSAAVSAAWAFGAFALVAVPYFVGWRAWWGPKGPFVLSHALADSNDALGQLFVIAFPEEAFYRGFLQSRFDEAWAPRWRLLGARVGPSLLATSAIFAVGHIATIAVPARLAVFFPALLFGWLRARTGGIGASVLLHALCNLYAQGLGRGYGVY